MIDRIPPQSIEAEQSVLGSILIDPDAMLLVAPVITAKDFYRSVNGIIFEAMLTLYGRHEPYDIVTVSAELARIGQLDAIGGRTYLSSLSNLTPSSVHSEAYAKIIARKSTHRSLIAAAGKIAGIGYEDAADADEALDRAQQSLSEVTNDRRNFGFVSVKPLLQEAYDRIDWASQHKGEARGVQTGLKTLDKMTSGLQNGNLIILAARPSVGKTSLAINIAQHAAKNEGKKVGIFSLEMSKEELIERMLSSLSGVDSQRLRSGYLSGDDFTHISAAMSSMYEMDLYIDDAASVSVTQIRTQARRLQIEHGLDLVIVDYLQLMQATGHRRDGNRTQEVSDISRGLKVLAKELNVPVLALSQLSRAPESREGDGKPRLSDLRESGSIEQDADVVMFLWRPKPKNRNEFENESNPGTETISLLLAKARNGPTGEMDLAFVKHRTTFHEMEDDSRMPGGYREASQREFQY